eukprot:9035117-Alexandrium_andersonii.AAC.1
MPSLPDHAPATRRHPAEPGGSKRANVVHECNQAPWRSAVATTNWLWIRRWPVCDHSELPGNERGGGS